MIDEVLELGISGFRLDASGNELPEAHFRLAGHANEASTTTNLAASPPHSLSISVWQIRPLRSVGFPTYSGYMTNTLLVLSPALTNLDPYSRRIPQKGSNRAQNVGLPFTQPCL